MNTIKAVILWLCAVVLVGALSYGLYITDKRRTEAEAVKREDLIKSMDVDRRIRYDRKASSGKVKLERVEKVNGIECCILAASLTLVPCGMDNLPEGTDFTGSTLKMTLTCPVPMDPATLSPDGNFVADVAVKADFKTPDGGARRLETVGKVSREESFKPIK